MIEPIGYFCVDGGNGAHSAVTAMTDRSNQHYRHKSYHVQGLGWCVFIFLEHTTDIEIQDFLRRGVDTFLKQNQAWVINYEVEAPETADASL